MKIGRKLPQKEIESISIASIGAGVFTNMNGTLTYFW